MESFLLQSGIVSASLQIVLDRFTTDAQKKLALVLGADNELKKLERTLLKVQALVDNVRAKQHHFPGHEAQQLWLRDLQSALHEADDLLDEISLEILKLSSNSASIDFNNMDQGQVRNLVFSRFKFCSPSKMYEMRQKLEDIAREMDGTFIDEVLNVRQPHSLGKLQTSSLVDESRVIARENDKREIISLLLSKETKVSVVAIVGMVGVGKTTLAQLVYNHAKVVGKFNLRIWVSVSVDYTVERISRSIVECASRKRFELSDLDPIQMRLKEIVKGKKFLIVLDGIWSEDANDWDTLCLPFKFAAKGSRILVTTQSMLVASIVATSPPYHVQTLSDEDCLKLIKQRAFSGMTGDENKELEEIGLKIAQRCNGLPLTAVVLGSALRFKSDELEWDAILKSKIWDLPGNQNQVIQVLKLGYDHLAPCLKKCFAYCSIFPANFEFKKEDLVQLWVSEGFIQPKGVRRVEDIGKEYFDVLFQRSFFQKSHPDDPADPLYKMHSLIHDLAQFVSDEVCIRIEDHNSLSRSNMRNARHSSLLYKDIMPDTLEVFPKCGCLRTFILLSEGSCQIKNIPNEFFLNLPCMRVLNLSSSKIAGLPISIETLKHLRHLDVSDTDIEELPESITNLYGMETLKLKNCPDLVQLPENLKNLTNLRHLEFDKICQISSMPLEIGKLANLQSLSAFIVGKERGRRIEELEGMNFLHGSIRITNLENVNNGEEASKAKLEQKLYLDGLELQWEEDEGLAEEILGRLQPPNRIKWLTITNYGGSMFPGWLGNPTFRKIEMIVLQNCRYCKVLPSLGQLPMLKHLKIEKMHDLIYVEGESSDRSSSSFPCLKSLKFDNMQNLQEWRGLKEGDMPNLSELTIVDCPNLSSLPALHYLASLENLDIICCTNLQCLPDRGLPNSMKCLIIIDSHILKERCKVNEGQDWSKIQSIPKVEIDYVLVTQH